MRLDELKTGGTAKIMSVGGDSPLRRRLLDMGLTPGTSVRMLEPAPSGDPLAIHLRSFELTLRREEGGKIQVEASPEIQLPHCKNCPYARTCTVPVDLRPSNASASAECVCPDRIGADSENKDKNIAPSSGKRVTASDREGRNAFASDRGHANSRTQEKPELSPAEANEKIKGKHYTIALSGNQNSGKTTLFNALTGSNQKVGNFPGVTVSKKEAALRRHPEFTVVDLPGIYSLSPYSEEEVVTRDFLIDERPDVILNIIDTTMIERSLYLTLQLMEMNIPMVLALNMMDELLVSGGHVHLEKIEELLGIPVVPISASKKQGLPELIDRTIQEATRQREPHLDLCSGPVHRSLHAIMTFIDDHAAEAGLSPRYAATKLMERDPLIQNRLHIDKNEVETCEHMVLEMENSLKTDNLAALADMRYQFIDEVCQEAVHKGVNVETPRSTKIDRILCHKYWGLPIFVAVLGLTFWLSFGSVGGWLAERFQDLLTLGTSAASDWLNTVHISVPLHSFIVEGFLAGVGSVLSFLPLILMLFFLLSLLEDSGYMARVAFLMDSTLRRMGLSGASIVPLIMGFGCSVPAIMATRTLAGRRDRRMTIFLIPFMSCSAKVPIYGAIAFAFFPRYAGLVMIGMYLLGILLAIVSGLLMKQARLEGEPAPFILELPPYRFPSLRSVLRNLWGKIRDFLTRAFTIILLVNLVIWFLRSFDAQFIYTTNPDQSLLALLGTAILPIFLPLGIADWRAPAALISGFTAKEAIISTVAVMSGASVDALTPTLQGMFSPAAALAFLSFVLLYTPCVAAISTARAELGSWRLAGAMVLAQCALAWFIGFLTYRAALLVAANWLWTPALVALIAVFLVGLRFRSRRSRSPVL